MQEWILNAKQGTYIHTYADKAFLSIANRCKIVQYIYGSNNMFLGANFNIEFVTN